MQTVVIVGASLAGTRAAETLRDEGFDGSIVLVGAEEHLPYDRPPLSKQYLSGEWSVERLALIGDGELADLGIETRMATAAVGVDSGAHLVLLDDGSTLPYDGLVIATGARPRMIPGLVADGTRLHTIRSLDDSRRLAEHVRSGRVLGVIGGGFLGSEVASVAAENGADVVVIERASTPMGDVLGAQVGADMAELMREKGVRLRTGVSVSGVSIPAVGSSGSVDIALADGSSESVDAALIAIGAVPNIEWLANSGLQIEDGLVCDRTLFAGDSIVGAGDVVRIRLIDGTIARRSEHWTSAAEQGQRAAHNLLAGRDAATEFDSVPYVWSDQFGVRIETFGRPRPDDEIERFAVAADAPAGVYLHRRDGLVTGCIGLAATRSIVGLRRHVHKGGSLDDAAEVLGAAVPSAMGSAR
ncbi:MULTISPECIES: FAD-dependent oxidoreductase [unclassified Gordonia (in: high G+C Gram-positive bacteria)]|uniref:NAD(P)/FAD-dependent oxidoreductase n=1 Tax=unclassified Gordonia (in: high G+C Gram-positive bacteria) TaxID=2657482 RepID=UPI0009AD043B|nr:MULTISPECIES: FAD-dependent oxidoreductase [unclassified Gordonia (in: high G+C Gram-positive bacteria)]MDF3282975.1 FAD-dependent oxidoreductase [Gordonia sp. N1V]OPX10764.1 hypothetical protein B1964_23215 [Gordonia sp. i37]